MICINPIRVFNSKEGKFDTVPCGKCYACLLSKGHDWYVRLRAEEKVSQRVDFVTLTYDEKYIPKNDNGVNELKVNDLQNFFKRLRKKEKIRYFAIGEYGPLTYRPHYHMLIYNLENEENLQKAWPKGFIVRGFVTEYRIRYVSGYMLKKDIVPRGTVKPFSVMSRRPGIGKPYLDQDMKMYLRSRNDGKMNMNGREYRLPRYFIDKVFDEPERKRIANIREEYVKEKFEDLIKSLSEKSDRPLKTWSDRIKFQEELFYKKRKQFKNNQL